MGCCKKEGDHEGELVNTECERCSHCGEPLEWFDMFGIAWCYELYFGMKENYELCVKKRYRQA